jgi:uncharacterized integral membrane protein (TIGR00697 family)
MNLKGTQMTTSLHDRYGGEPAMTIDVKTLAWIIGLSAAFILTLVVADFAAVRFIDLGWVVTPAGALLFAVVFITRDMLHKVAGAKVVKQVILIGIVLNILVAAFMYAVTFLPAPGFRPSAAFDAVFRMAPGIVLGSVVAALASQYVNTWVYQWMWDRDHGSWSRTIGSNLVSLPIDAVIFVILAFVVFPPMFGGTAIAFDSAIARIVSGSTLFKLGVILALTPLVSLGPTRNEARELN